MYRITNGCCRPFGAGTAFPPLRGSKPAPKPGVRYAIKNESSTRMKGKIISWKDDKGFGFISPEGKNEQVFFHISSVKKAIRKPEVGDIVIFEVAKDSQGRLKATHVLLEGVSLSNSGNSKRIITEPVKKDALDYFAYFALAVLIAISLGLFIKTGAPES